MCFRLSNITKQRSCTQQPFVLYYFIPKALSGELKPAFYKVLLFPTSKLQLFHLYYSLHVRTYYCTVGNFVCSKSWHLLWYLQYYNMLVINVQLLKVLRLHVIKLWNFIFNPMYFRLHTQKSIFKRCWGFKLEH